MLVDDSVVWVAASHLLSRFTLTFRSSASRSILYGPMTISSPAFRPLVTSISVVPVMPVVTGTKLRLQLAAVRCCSTKTPCTGASLRGRRSRCGIHGLHRGCLALSEAAVAHGQRLNGNREHVLPCRGGDLRRVESPGRRSSQVLVSVTTTLKSLASSVPVVLWLVAMPVERRIAWSPTSVTCPLKTLPGKGIDCHIDGLAHG